MLPHPISYEYYITSYTLGITGQALAWYKSYLSDRTLRIEIDKSFSEL